MNFEDKIKELEAELEGVEPRAEANREIRNKVIENNLHYYGGFFKSNGINFLLKDVEARRYYQDDATQFEFTFLDDTGHYIRLCTLLNKEKTEYQIQRIYFPEMDLRENVTENYDAKMDYFEKANHFMKTIRNNDNFIKALGHYEIPEFIPGRDKYEITNEIRQLKEQQRIAGLNFRVGATLMVKINGRRGYYGYWSKCIITKINKKTVQFVYVYDNNLTSEPENIDFDYSYFRTEAEHQIEEAKKKNRYGC